MQVEGVPEEEKVTVLLGDRDIDPYISAISHGLVDILLQFKHESR